MPRFRLPCESQQVRYSASCGVSSLWGGPKARRRGTTAEIVRTWGAAALRPYKSWRDVERERQDAVHGRSKPRPYKLVARPSFFDVAVDYFSGVAAFGQGCADGFGEHDGAVAAAGATEGDRQVALPFADIVGHQVDEQALDALEEFAGLRERTDVFANLRVLASETAQARHEMRIGQEAHVENQIGV